MTEALGETHTLVCLVYERTRDVMYTQLRQFAADPEFFRISSSSRPNSAATITAALRPRLSSLTIVHFAVKSCRSAPSSSIRRRKQELQRSHMEAERMQNGGEEVQEPQAKLQKVLKEIENDHGEHHNIDGVADVELAVDANAALRVKKLSPHAILPSRGSALAAGYDLSSAYECVVPARGKALVKTDLSIAIPVGTYARVAPRSGLAWKHSIDVGAGVIDADYRGPVGVILFNHSDTDFTIQAGDRIAQLILQLIITPQVLEVEDLDTTTRGEGGFGSTGIVALVVDP